MDRFFLFSICLLYLTLICSDAACNKDCSECIPNPAFSGNSLTAAMCAACRDGNELCDANACMCAQICGNYDSLDLFLIKENREASDPPMPEFVPEYRSLLKTLDERFEEFRTGFATFTNKPMASHASAEDYCFKKHAPLHREVERSFVAAENLTPIASHSHKGRGGRAALEALLEVARSPASRWSGDPKTARLAVIVTSTPCKEGMEDRDLKNHISASEACAHENYPSVAELQAALIDANVTPLFVVTKDVAVHYRDLASRIEGSVVVAYDGKHLKDAIMAALDGYCKSEMSQADDISKKMPRHDHSRFLASKSTEDSDPLRQLHAISSKKSLKLQDVTRKGNSFRFLLG